MDYGTNLPSYVIRKVENGYEAFLTDHRNGCQGIGKIWIGKTKAEISTILTKEFQKELKKFREDKNERS